MGLIRRNAESRFGLGFAGRRCWPVRGAPGVCLGRGRGWAPQGVGPGDMRLVSVTRGAGLLGRAARLASTYGCSNRGKFADSRNALIPVPPRKGGPDLNVVTGPVFTVALPQDPSPQPSPTRGEGELSWGRAVFGFPAAAVAQDLAGPAGALVELRDRPFRGGGGRLPERRRRVIGLRLGLGRGEDRRRWCGLGWWGRVGWIGRTPR
jgi:hypothetical protein